jgi:large subunit ribosomal protein L7/L12
MEEREIEIPEKFKKIVEAIEKMTVLDLAEFIKVLEKKFGVSSQPQFAPMAMPQTGVQTPAATEKEEKSLFNVVLTQVGAKKIEVIKLVREITGLGLKDAKDLVDKAESEPQTIKENVKKEEAEELKKKFEGAGAKVELK